MNYKKITVLLILIIYTQNIVAKNKQQIFLTNEYGDAVIVKFTWKSNNFPYFSSDEIINVREHDKNLGVKAPYSFYKLIGISASPKLASEESNNVADDSQEFEIPLVAVNEDVLTDKHVQGLNYFIIKASTKDSAIPGQKKIYIQGYGSQQKYAAEIAKTEQQQKLISQHTVTQQIAPVVHAIPVAQPIQEPTRVSQPIHMQNPIDLQTSTIGRQDNQIRRNLDRSSENQSPVREQSNQPVRYNQESVTPVYFNQSTTPEQNRSSTYAQNSQYSASIPQQGPVVLLHPFSN